MKIILNGIELNTSMFTVNYYSILRLIRISPNNNPTITFSSGKSNKQGTLTKNSDPLVIEEGMIFNCIVTQERGKE